MCACTILRGLCRFLSFFYRFNLSTVDPAERKIRPKDRTVCINYSIYTGIMESSGPPSDVHTADACNPDFFGAAHDQESKGKRALEVLTPHHCFISALPHLTQRVGKAALHGSRYHRPRRDSSNTSTPSFEILKSFPVGASGDDDARCEGNVKCRVN